MLFPFEPSAFWNQLRQIVKEEVARAQCTAKHIPAATVLPGLIQKPLYKTAEICAIFKISKPTVYDWVKEGKLRKVKIKSRVYFLGSEVSQLLQL